MIVSPPIFALSADSWTELLEYLDTYEQTSIWLIGSKHVQQKLAIQGGWKALNFDASSPKTKWPRLLLSQLVGLSSLRITVYEPKCLLPNLKPTLKDIAQLPKGLSELELNLKESLRDEHISLLPPQLVRLSLPLNRSISTKGVLQLPSTLSILDLKSNLQITDLSVLPRDLEHYEGNSVAVSPTLSLCRSLPPMLATLRLGKVNFSKSKWKMSDLTLLSAHQSLTCLSIDGISRQDSSELDLLLPPNLMTLELIGDPFLPKSSLASLPHDLTTLSLVSKYLCPIDWDDESIQMLPRHLTYLKAYSTHYPHAANWIEGRLTFDACSITPKCFEWLPRELKTLYLPILADLSNGSATQQETLDEHMIHMPSTLTDMHIFYGRTIYLQELLTPSWFCLPPHLQYYHYGCLVIPNYKLAEVKSASDSLAKTPHSSSTHSSSTNLSFPFELKALSQSPRDRGPTLTLYIPNSQYDTRLATNVCSLFPVEWHRSLTELRIGGDVWPGAHFPPHLTKFKIWVKSQLNDRDLLHLPSSLTDLTLTTSYISTCTDECIPALPPDLTRLKVIGIEKVSYAVYPLPRRIQKLHLGESNSEKYRPIFPPWTTHLKLDDSKVSAYTFQNGLPTFLTKLVLKRTAIIPSSALVPFLPDTLTHLEAPCLDLIDQDVLHLPAGLLTYIAPEAGSTLSHSSAHQWPPILRHLCIKGNLYTKNTLKLLPRSITLLELKGARYVTNSSVGFLGPRARLISPESRD